MRNLWKLSKSRKLSVVVDITSSHMISLKSVVAEVPSCLLAGRSCLAQNPSFHLASHESHENPRFQSAGNRYFCSGKEVGLTCHDW